MNRNASGEAHAGGVNAEIQYTEGSPLLDNEGRRWIPLE